MKIIYDSLLDLEKRAAEKIGESISKVLEEKENALLGLVGGNSITGIFPYLVAEDISWDKVHIFLADERIVPVVSEKSNYKAIYSRLVRPLKYNLGFNSRNIHPVRFPRGNRKPEINYQKEFLKFGKEFDVAVLSAGEDGHIASLFPNHPSIRNESNYFIRVDNSPKLPLKRVSSSRKMLQRTKYPILFFGYGKEQAYESFTEPTNEFIKCPARLLKECENLCVLTQYN